MSDSLKLRSDGLRIERGGGMRLVGRKSRARTDGLRVVRDTMSSKASNEGPGDDSRMLEHCAAHTSSRNTASRPASCMSREQSCTRRDAHWGWNRQIMLLVHWDILHPNFVQAHDKISSANLSSRRSVTSLPFINPVIALICYLESNRCLGTAQKSVICDIQPVGSLVIIDHHLKLCCVS